MLAAGSLLALDRGTGEESVTTTLIASPSQTRMRATPILALGFELLACWIAFVTSSQAMIPASDE